MSKFRAFCFTLNNYTSEDVELVKQWDCVYLIFGKEVGESGTPHLQGYVSFENQKTLSTLKKKFHKAAHWEAAKGTPKQASEYCEKDGDVFEKGTRPMSQIEKGLAEQTRWKDAFKCVEENRLDEMDDQIKCLHLKQIEYAVARTKAVKRKLETLDGEMEHEWIYGPTGTGKSYAARYENPDAYVKLSAAKWWDDYDFEEVVIVEEVGLKAAEHAEDFKQMLDRYKYRVEVKGGSMLVRPRKIVITSNYHPSQIWTTPEALEPIMRRLRFRHLALPWKPPITTLPITPL